MKIWIISFTKAGSQIGKRLVDELKSYGDEVRVWLKYSSDCTKSYDKVDRSCDTVSSCDAASLCDTVNSCGAINSCDADSSCDAVGSCNAASSCGAVQLSESLSEWTRKAFLEAAALVFVGAVGIAVRAIAPYITDKYHDPAVIVIDSRGQFCIPLLSGHIGGANRLCRKLSGILDAIPVITTATDDSGTFAVDLFAADNSLTCIPRELCKNVSSMILSGQMVGFSSDYPVGGTLPEYLTKYEVDDIPFTVGKNRGLIGSHSDETIPTLGIYITKYIERKLYDRTLFLVPRSIWLGIGCRRGISEEMISHAVESFLSETKISKFSVTGIATCDIKKDEEGLLAYSKTNGWDLQFFTVEELKEQEGSFTSSVFVSKTIGVDNVCERASVAASGKGGKLIIPKKIFDGITIAAAEALPKIQF
ncbi:MAG: cobalamin biosynthesis protein [Lachnospiraceae bacterium]|nr:cobalamin biosynthesis protein [Lachnospiraceae bacterium]